MINAPDMQPTEVEYPAEFHFRVICDSAADLFETINVITERYTITQKLDSSKTSTSGKYQSFSVSIIFESRAAMVDFDREIKAVPGMRMLL